MRLLVVNSRRLPVCHEIIYIALHQIRTFGMNHRQPVFLFNHAQRGQNALFLQHTAAFAVHGKHFYRRKALLHQLPNLLIAALFGAGKV